MAEYAVNFKPSARREFENLSNRLIARLITRIEGLVNDDHKTMSVTTFGATGITAYLKNSNKLEIAQHFANHESQRTT